MPARQVRISYTLTGPRLPLTAGGSLATLALVAPELTALADVYRARVTESLARTHGRTGHTAESAATLPAVPTPVEATARVRFGGSIRAVVSALPPHMIAARRAPMLENPHPGAPGVGRAGNRYAPFGPVPKVMWRQGGPESYSPDRAWYEHEQPWLDAQGYALATRLAPAIGALWRKELGPGVVLVERD